MEPLKITFRLATPAVLPDSGLHLDGLLALMQMESVGDGDVDCAIADLPLEIADSPDGGPKWVFKASMLWPERPFPVATMPYRRKLDRIEELGYEDDAVRGVIRKLPGGRLQRTAHYKWWSLQAGVRWADSMVAWCIGDKAGVVELVSRVTHVGKLARLDMGRVVESRVERDEDAHSFWRWRNMPFVDHPAMTVTHAPTVGCTHPPYWRRDMARTCHAPLLPPSPLMPDMSAPAEAGKPA